VEVSVDFTRWLNQEEADSREAPDDEELRVVPGDDTPYTYRQFLQFFGEAELADEKWSQAELVTEASPSSPKRPSDKATCVFAAIRIPAYKHRCSAVITLTWHNETGDQITHRVETLSRTRLYLAMMAAIMTNFLDLNSARLFLLGRYYGFAFCTLAVSWFAFLKEISTWRHLRNEVRMSMKKGYMTDVLVSLRRTERSIEGFLDMLIAFYGMPWAFAGWRQCYQVLFQILFGMRGVVAQLYERDQWRRHEQGLSAAGLRSSSRAGAACIPATTAIKPTSSKAHQPGDVASDLPHPLDSDEEDPTADGVSFLNFRFSWKRRQSKAEVSIPRKLLDPNSDCMDVLPKTSSSDSACYNRSFQQNDRSSGKASNPPITIELQPVGSLLSHNADFMDKFSNEAPISSGKARNRPITAESLLSRNAEVMDNQSAAPSSRPGSKTTNLPSARPGSKMSNLRSPSSARPGSKTSDPPNPPSDRAVSQMSVNADFMDKFFTEASAAPPSWSGCFHHSAASHSAGAAPQWNGMKSPLASQPWMSCDGATPGGNGMKSAQAPQSASPLAPLSWARDLVVKRT
jgi:hypothetical protein